jgi:hypothetical protein
VRSVSSKSEFQKCWKNTKLSKTGIRSGSCNPSYRLGGRNLRMVCGRVTLCRTTRNMSIRTGLPDLTMQTKFQSKRPSDVETPVPSIWVQKLSSIGTVSTWMGDRLMGLSSSYLSPRKKLISCWLPVLYHIVRNWSNALQFALHYTRIVESISMTEG